MPDRLDDLLEEVGFASDDGRTMGARIVSIVLGPAVMLGSAWLLGQLLPSTPVVMVLSWTLGSLSMLALIGLVDRLVTGVFSALIMLLKALVPAFFATFLGIKGWSYITSEVIVDNTSTETWALRLNGHALARIQGRTHERFTLINGSHTLTIINSSGKHPIKTHITHGKLRLAYTPHVYLISPKHLTCYEEHTVHYGGGYGGPTSTALPPAEVYEFKTQVDGWFTPPPKEVTSEYLSDYRTHIQRIPCESKVPISP